MKAHTFAAILLMLAMPLAGCISPSPAETPTPGPSSTDDGGEAAPADAPPTGTSVALASTGVGGADNGTRPIVVNAKYTTDGVAKGEGAACDPADPTRCTASATGFMFLTGDLEGMFIDASHVWPNTDASFYGRAERTFMGSVAGCGSGTMTLVVDGDTTPLEPDTNHPGYLYFREPPMRLLSGSTSTGLAGIVAFRVTADFNFTAPFLAGFGTWKGTVWCHTADVPTLPASHDGAREVAVSAEGTTDGFVLADALGCGPKRAGGCEVYTTQTMALAGTLTGSLIDYEHFHVGSGGSVVVEAWRFFIGEVADCGSGTFALHLKGTADRPEPDLAHPGYLLVTEPPMMMLPGSTTTGLAGLVDAQLIMDLWFQGEGAGFVNVGGTVWC